MSQNIVEFILSLKDQWSNPMAHVTKSTAGAGYTIDQLNESNKKLREAAGKSAGSIADLRGKINALRQTKELIPISATKQMRELTREIDKLQGALDKAEGNKGAIGGMFSGLPKLLPIAAVTAGITHLVGGAMKGGKVKEQFKNDFGAAAGAGLYEGLKKMKGILGEGVLDLGKQLALAGEPIAKVEDKIKRLGDVANGDEAKLSALVSGFAQLRKDGRLTESTLSALEAGGFKPLVLMSQQTGMSLARLRERFAAGKISAKQIEEALRKATDAGGQFAGNMDRLANTPQGHWDTLVAKVLELGEKISGFLLPIVLPAFNFIADSIDMVSEGISVLVDWLQPLVKWGKENAAMLQIFGGAALGMAAAIKTVNVVKSVWMGLTTKLIPKIIAMNAALFANPIGLVIGAIAALAAGIAIAWNKFETFRKVVYGVWETVKSVFTAIGNLFKQIFEPIGEAIAAFKEGRWMDLAKATGKMLFNLSPVGIVKNVVEFSKNGGFDDVGKAYERGAAKGAESWAKSQAEKEADRNKASIDAVTGMPTDNSKDRYNRTQDSNNVQAGINAISGCGTKYINININKFDYNLTYLCSNVTHQMLL